MGQSVGVLFRELYQKYIKVGGGGQSVGVLFRERDEGTEKEQVSLCPF